MYCFGSRSVLDKLHQRIAEHDFARRHSHILANFELIKSNRRLALLGPYQIFNEVVEPADQVLPALLHRDCKNFRVGQQVVGWRKHVQQLAGNEIHHVFMLLRDAAHIGGCVVPPLLSEQKRLRVETERPTFPGLIGKAFVLRQRVSTGSRVIELKKTGLTETREFSGFSERFLHQMRLFARSCCQMDCPVCIGFPKRTWGNPAC